MYKILAIDGGGIHGYADIVIIKRLLKECPDLIEKADLIAGTSIGGILALGFAAGHSIGNVEENFIKGIPLAFNTNPARLIGFYAGFTTKYDTSKFKVYLRGVYGGGTLNQLQKRIVIPTFCLDDEASIHRRWRAKIFHNFPGSDCDCNAKMVDVAMATSAVPVFFPVYDKYVDGALIANNPALCAVMQTQDRRNEDPVPKLDDICVLSLGTIRDMYLAQKSAQWGYFAWAHSIFHAITERDTLVVNYIADLLLPGRYHRLEPVINGPMDNFEALAGIRKAGLDYSLEDTFTWLKKYWM